MLLTQDISVLVLLIPALVFSLCVHEFSHGIVALWYGDDTAQRYGRLTLNPLAHLDPMGSLMLLFVGFGYAKPVPVNAYNLKNPRSDMIKDAAAGPISNLLLSFIGLTLLTCVCKFNDLILHGDLKIQYFSLNPPGQTLDGILTFLTLFTIINIYLAIFNLIPVYPLDGGQIFGNIISRKNPKLAQNLIIYGPRVLLGMILISLIIPGFSIFSIILQPITSIICEIMFFLINGLTFFI